MNDIIVVSTTSSLEGWEIQKYLGTVTFHVVEGTSFFSDFFAKYSDFWGGRNKSYQNALASIKNEAIAGLKLKARELNANCVIGISIDFDEISGKDKQMFMVSAIGTAVYAKNDNINIQEMYAQNNKLSDSELEVLLQKRSLLNKINDPEFKFDDKVWKFIISNKIHKVANSVINYLESSKDSLNFEKIIELSGRYFMQIDKSVAKKVLYDSFASTDTIKNVIRRIIVDGSFIDYHYLFQLLKSDDMKSQKRALELLKFHKSFYSIDDLNLINQLVKYIKDQFAIELDIVQEKAKLSGKVQNYWICKSCDFKNKETDSYCIKCQKDSLGFSALETKPQQVLDLLINKAIILEEELNVQEIQ